MIRRWRTVCRLRVGLVSEQPVDLPSARRPRPGRPRKAETGHVPGTSPLQGAEKAKAIGSTLASQAIAPEEGRKPRWSTLARAAVVPRLLSLEQAALYLGVSPRTVRDLETAGTLKLVRVPLPSGGELRKLLFDRIELDHLIEAWKDRP
jgi:hypothetical protein